MNYSLKLAAIAMIPFLATAQEKSALERDPSGWIDIMPGPKLEGWTRLPIAPDPLDPVSQWKREGEVLVCEGNRGHDWLRYDKELGDVMFHVELRYTPVEGNPRYNSGIFIRNKADYSLWYQAQVGASSGGFLFGLTYVDGRVQRFMLNDRLVDQRVKPAGEWNVFEVSARGSMLTNWVNGAVVSEYKWCPVEKGHLGLEGEGFRIEFRNLKIKPLGPTPVQ